MKFTYLYTFEDGHQETHIYHGSKSNAEAQESSFFIMKRGESYACGTNDDPEGAKRNNIVNSECISEEED